MRARQWFIDTTTAPMMVREAAINEYSIKVIEFEAYEKLLKSHTHPITARQYDNMEDQLEVITAERDRYKVALETISDLDSWYHEPSNTYKHNQLAREALGTKK